MTLEMTIRIAARLRGLTAEEFDALRRMIEAGDEPQDEPTLANVCEALADCADLVRDEAGEPLAHPRPQRRPNRRAAHA